MRAITNIYNSFIHTNTSTAIFVLTFFGILSSFIIVMFVMLLADLVVGSESISYYSVGIILSLIIPIIATPLLSYKIIELSKKLSTANKKLSQHIQYDKLTKVYNKRHTLELASYEFALSRRANKPISALFIDYKNFKEINITYGYEIGDIVLIELSRSINATIRNTDIFGRYEGEKFILICPGLDINTAQNLAQKIRVAVEQTIHINDDAIKMSVNIGCSEVRDFSNNDLQTLIDKAKTALIQEKNSNL